MQFGLALMALGSVLPRLFSTNPRVLNRAHTMWPTFAALQPVNTSAFGLDGIFHGAADTRFSCGDAAALVAGVPCARGR